MELTPFQQIEQMVKEKQRILLLTHVNIDGDALGSIIATYLFLKKLGKDVTAICSELVPDPLKFLPITDVLQTEFNGTRDFIVTLDCKKAAVDKLKYAVEDNKINIIITPKSGHFEEKDVSFRKGSIKYDLIIVLDTPDLSKLGSLYENNTELFYEVPVLNIDHHASNSRFGHVHLIDTVASSTTEILFELFKYLQKKEQFIDKDIATLILAGIITDTGSFQNPNTTPKSLEIAADLIDFGANQQEIIRNVYKTKNLTTLKLWGKVLSKLQVDAEHRIVWSNVSVHDLQETKANINEAGNIIDELMTNAPGAEIVVLFREEEKGFISASIRTIDPNVNASKIASLFGGGGHRQAAGFKIKGEEDLHHAIMKIIDKLRLYQKERLEFQNQKVFEIPPVDQKAKQEEIQSIQPPSRKEQAVQSPSVIISAKAEPQRDFRTPLNPLPERNENKDLKNDANKTQPSGNEEKTKKSFDVVERLTENKKNENTNGTIKNNKD